MAKARGGAKKSTAGARKGAGRGGPKAKAKPRARVEAKPRRQPAPAPPKRPKAKPKARVSPSPKTPTRARKTPSTEDTLPQATDREPIVVRITSASSGVGPDTLREGGPAIPRTVARATQLDWNDSTRAEPSADALVERWANRGDELLVRLSAHGAADHEYRADLREGRFVWVAPDGRVSAEARVNVLCSWSRSTSVVAMAWADPLVRACGVPRVDGMPAERDDVDEELAWRVAMEAADATSAEYLYRVPTPHAWYFLALRDLTFAPARDSFRPGTPVGLVLRELGETRHAIESRAEPSHVIKRRLQSVGDALLQQAQYAYRSTDWVARLERTGKRMLHLGGLVPRVSYGSIAAGRGEEWLARDLAVDLIHAISLLEDEWNAFA